MNLPNTTQGIQTMSNIATEIQRAVDDTSSASMSLSEDELTLEIARRLDELATTFMSKRPDLASASLDEWLAQHHDQLTRQERQDGMAILEAY
jgi:predicted transcriptional regulator